MFQRWRSLAQGTAVLAAVLLFAPPAWRPAHAQGEAVATPAYDLPGHAGPVRRLAADPAGRHVVTASDDKTAIVWRADDASPLHTLRVPVGDDEAGRLYGAAVSPDGRSVAVGGGGGGTSRLFLFDLATGAFRAAFEPHAGGLRNLQWSADGRWLAAVYVGKPALRVFDAANGRLLHEQPLPGDAYGLSLSAAGQLVVASFDGRLRWFRLAADGLQPEGESATTPGDPVSVRHAPDGRTLAVGYFSRAGDGALRVDVFDAATRERQRSFSFGDLASGNLMTVGWQADGAALYAAGTAAQAPGRVLVRRIAWPGGEVDTGVAAADGITDLVPLAGGGVAFASLDGSWGRLDGTRVAARGEAPLLRVAHAGALRSNADATTLDWHAADGTRHSFDLPARRAGDGDPVATRAALVALPALRLEAWEHTRAPRLGGQVVELAPGETSRAATLLPDGDGAVFGTSRALRRVGRDGRPVWTVPLPAEARALVVSADGRRLVVALADGSLRWRRAADGAALLNLLPLRGGRWVVWTDAGWYDAAPGAEHRFGWLLPRAGGARADYFGAGRWREGWHRPDVIDRVLAEHDVGVALQRANQVRAAAAAAPPPRPLPLSRPPVLTLTDASVVAGELQLGVELHPPAGGAVEHVSVRVDGRPVEARFEPAPGGLRGQLTLARPPAAARVQLFAEGAQRTSMPATLALPAPRAPAPAGVPVLRLLAVGPSAPQVAAAFEGRVAARVLADPAVPALAPALRWLQDGMAAHDVALVSWAGPGADDAALRRALAAVPGRVLLLADRCAGLAQCDGLGAVTGLANAHASAEHGVAVLAPAATPGAEPRPGDRALFVQAVAEALAAGGLTFDTLSREVDRALRARSAGRLQAVAVRPEALPDFELPVAPAMAARAAAAN